MNSNSLTSYNQSIQINQQTLISKIKHQPLNNISALFNQAFIQATGVEEVQDANAHVPVHTQEV